MAISTSTQRAQWHSVYGIQRFRGNTVHEGTIEVDGELTHYTAPVSGSGTAITVTEATHHGKTTYLPNTDEATATHVLPAPSAGAHYHFVYAGGAVDANNHAFDITENGTFDGNITFLHEGANDSVDVVRCDADNNDLLTAVTPAAMDLHFHGVSSTVYLVYGTVTSAATPTCANG